MNNKLKFKKVKNKLIIIYPINNLMVNNLFFNRNNINFNLYYHILIIKKNKIKIT